MSLASWEHYEPSTAEALTYAVMSILDLVGIAYLIGNCCCT